MKSTLTHVAASAALALAIATAATTPSFAFGAKTFWEQQGQR